MIYYIMLCYIMLCYVVLYYNISYHIYIPQHVLWQYDAVSAQFPDPFLSKKCQQPGPAWLVTVNSSSFELVSARTTMSPSLAMFSWDLVT